MAIGDLIWSDPIDLLLFLATFPGTTMADYESDRYMYTPNLDRFCSWYFTFRALQTFLADNKFTRLFRAHSAVEDGFALMLSTLLVLVFSVSRYTVNQNRGAYVLLSADGHKNEVKTFDCPKRAPVEHVTFSVITEIRLRCPGLFTDLGSFLNAIDDLEAIYGLAYVDAREVSNS